MCLQHCERIPFRGASEAALLQSYGAGYAMPGSKITMDGATNPHRVWLCGYCCCQKIERTEKVLIFFDIKEKSHFSSSEKCEILAETERFEKQKLDFCNLYQSISGILFCYFLYFATLYAYCSGCSRRGCCQIAVSTPRPKRVDGFYPSARFLFSETGISADSA